MRLVLASNNAKKLAELQTLFADPEGANLRGRVRIDMSTGIARQLVLPRLPELMQRHPLLEVELSSTDRRVDLVREGFDCVIRVGTVAEPGLVARPLGLVRVATCASPAYLARKGTPYTLDDLAQHELDVDRLEVEIGFRTQRGVDRDEIVLVAHRDAVAGIVDETGLGAVELLREFAHHTGHLRHLEVVALELRELRRVVAFLAPAIRRKLLNRQKLE